MDVKPVSPEIASEVRSKYPLLFLQMNEPQSRFIRVKNLKGRMPRTRVLECGNKVGKTHIGIAEDIAHMQVHEDSVELETLLGEGKTIPGRVTAIDFTTSKILLEQRQTVSEKD